MSGAMASRPRAGRGIAGRDISKDVDIEADILAQITEGLKKAQQHQDRSAEIGREIVALEEDIKAKGGSKSLFSFTAQGGLASCASSTLTQALRTFAGSPSLSFCLMLH